MTLKILQTNRPAVFSVINHDMQDFTNSIPDKEEIWNIIKEMKKDASPGPDGFNVGFYRNAWSWIAQDITHLVRTFYETGIMPPKLNQTHIALIPKKLVCHLPSDFRPISLCNVVYKIISKSLANRLKPLLPDYIHPSQQAFIEGRRISDNITVAQEICPLFYLKIF